YLPGFGLGRGAAAREPPPVVVSLRAFPLRQGERVDVVPVRAGRLERERGAAVVDGDVLLAVDAVAHARSGDVRGEHRLPERGARLRVVGVELTGAAAGEDEPARGREGAAVARPRPLHPP